MDIITIPVGTSMKKRLGDLYEIHGGRPEQATSQGFRIMYAS